MYVLTGSPVLSFTPKQRISDHVIHCARKHSEMFRLAQHDSRTFNEMFVKRFGVGR
jgi:hypothetical protein